MSFQTPGLAPNRSAHRRVQSTVPVGVGAANMNMPFVQQAMGQFGTPGGMNMGFDPQQGARGGPGHGRRHSMNVVNKTPSAPNFGATPFPVQEGFDDGFQPPPPAGAHNRQASRSDAGWRMSESLIGNFAEREC